MSTAVATIISNENGPNTNIEAPNMLSLNELLITVHSIAVPIDASAEHISAITNDSENNILNTSFPLAPTARRIPISWRFCDIEVEMKLENRSIAKSANTRPT